MMTTAPVATHKALNDVAITALIAAVTAPTAAHAAKAPLATNTAAAMPPITAPRVTTKPTLFLIQLPILVNAGNNFSTIGNTAAPTDSLNSPI